MKRVLMTIVLLALLVGGCGYVGFTGGYGGESESANYSLEYDSIFLKEPKPEPVPGERDWLVVTGITIIDNAINTRYFKSNPETGVYFKIGVEVVPDTGFFLNALGGITSVWRDSAWSEKEFEIDGMYGGGITYFLNDGGTAIIASYDNKRGISAGVGFRY